MAKPVRVLGKFQCKKGDFWFVIPDDRADWGGDFFVHKNNFNGATDGKRVAAEVMDRDSGRKPEAKILEVFSGKNKEEDFWKVKKERIVEKTIEWIYSGWDGNFGFVDVEGEPQGYFVYGLKKNGARDGDKVRAEVSDFNGKPEAIVVEILWNESESLQGVYSDNDRFGFVKPDDKSWDIFIAGSRKWYAQDWDRVEVKIIKRGGKNPEGLIVEVL
jgi:exoribonuclease R